MLFFDDVSLPGHGTITGAFWDQGHKILAVASAFRLLTEPRARASYGGQRLRYRVALYRPPARVPFALFDAARDPIHDVAFHPTLPRVAIAVGSYDGGYCFEGDLFLWDWQSGASKTMAQAVPEVLRVRFGEDGAALHAIVRPWHEETDAVHGDPFKLGFALTFDASDMTSSAVAEKEIHAQMKAQVPVLASRLTEGHFPPLLEPTGEIIKAFALTRIVQRSPIWDVALIGADTVAAVHDACLVELYARDGTLLRSFTGEGHGTQVFGGRTPLVHVRRSDPRVPVYVESCKSELMALDGDGLSVVAALDGNYTFSVSQDGLVLGRQNRIPKGDAAPRDVVIDPASGALQSYDLGHYDVFNHYLRIDGSPYLFFVQGTPPQSHQKKHLCMVSRDGAVRRLWPLLPDTGEQASHAMECCFGYVHDERGEGIVVAGKHYSSSSAGGYRGFLYRKTLFDGVELWRHPTTASVTAIKTVPGTGLIVAAFLNGDIAVLHGASGKIIRWKAFEQGGPGNVAFSLDAGAAQIVVGLLDGRYGTLSPAELVDG